LCLNSNFFSQCFLYYNRIFHFVLTLLCYPVLRHGRTGLRYARKTACKVTQKF
jgi:hypothetical protein